MLLFILFIGIITFTSLLITKICNVTKKVDNIAIFYTCFLSQIFLFLFSSGFFFQSFTREIVLLHSIVFSAVTLFIFYKKKFTLSFSLKKGNISVWKWVKENVFLTFLAVLVFIELVWMVILTYLFPSYAWDDLWYHLPTIANWIQEKRIGIPPYSVWSQSYPASAELVYSSLLLFFKDDTWIDFSQYIFTIGGVIGVIGIAKWTGLKNNAAITAGLLFYLTPTIIVQSRTSYTDIALCSSFILSFYFLLRFIESGKGKFFIFSGIMAGMLIGTKFTGMLYVGMIGLVLLVHLIRSFYKKELLFKKILFQLFLYVFLVILVGGFWYIRNLVVFHNPLYPFTTTLAGHELFHGIGSVEDFITKPNEPLYVKDLNWFEKILSSWYSIGNYSYDDTAGGLGLNWIMVFFPCLVLMSGYFYRYNKRIFYQFLLPFIILFVLQPGNWWSRFTLSVLPIGIICTLHFYEICKIRVFSSIFKTLNVLCILTTVILSFPQVIFTPGKVIETYKLPKNERTVGNLYRCDLVWLDKYPGKKTIGYVSSPRKGAKEEIMYTSYPYLFFEKKLENKVILMDSKTKEEFIKKVDNDKVDYLAIPDNSVYVKWMKSYKQFKSYNYCEEQGSAFQYHLYKKTLK